MITIYCKLIAQEHDILGYITYVFENLEDAPFGQKYKMVTRWPNWQHKELNLGDIGYMTYKEVIAGKDTWYDSTTNTNIPYNYTNIIFIKFVQKTDDYKKSEIIL